MAISQNFPDVRPSLNLNFARSKTLDPRITFERASIGTYVDENGLIKTAAADEARFDHNPETGESLGLLIEERRINLVTYSNDITASRGWRNVSVSTMTAQNVSHIAPDGSTTVTELTGGGVNSWWALNTDYFQSTTYTVSAYVKVADGGSNFSGSFNLYTTISGGLAQGQPFTITSEWKRVSNVITTTSVTGIETVVIKTDESGRKFYVWGFQLEQGSFPTSYIPTSGSALTRQADLTQITGTNFSSWYNQPEGSYLFNAQTFKNAGNIYYGESGYGLANRNIMYANTTNGNAILYYIENNNNPVNTLSAGYTFATNTFVKTAYCYKQNDFGVFATGGLSNFDTSGNIHTANSFSIGMNNTNNGEHLNGHIKQLTYYPERLTNTQLQNLTK